MKVYEMPVKQVFAIVADDFGEIRQSEGGREYVYLPTPICMVPYDGAESREAAGRIADMICDFLTAQTIVSLADGEADAWEKGG